MGDLTEKEFSILQRFAGTTPSHGDKKDRRDVLLCDYLRLFELNDKAIVSIHNERTNNRLFCDRVDYLNADRCTGLMTPLANCKILYFMDPDDIYVDVPEYAEKILLEYYKDYGAKVKEE